MSSNHINTGVFIVPDGLLPDSWQEENILVANYQASTKGEREEIENILIATGRCRIRSQYDALSNDETIDL